MHVIMTTTSSFINALRPVLLDLGEYYTVHCILTIPEPGLPEWLPRAWKDGEQTVQVAAGLYQLPAKPTVYIRSSGSWISIDAENQRVEFSGRRHSLRDFFRCVPSNPTWEVTGWQYLTTREPNLAPWETTT